MAVGVWLAALLGIVLRSGAMALHAAPWSHAAEWLDSDTGGEHNWWSWKGRRTYLFDDGHAEFLAAAAIHPATDGLPDINLTFDGIRGADRRETRRAGSGLPVRRVSGTVLCMLCAPSR